MTMGIDGKVLTVFRFEVDAIAVGVQLPNFRVVRFVLIGFDGTVGVGGQILDSVRFYGNLL